MLQALISIAFFTAFTIYFFLGVYSLTLNIRAALNQVFLLLCISFSVWAITFSIMNSAQTYEEALLWRRASSMGWGVTYSIIVHFILILTEKHRLLKTKWIYLALYIPAAFNIFFFGIYKEVANEQHNLIKTMAGWGTIPLNNIWELFFNFYYISFSLIAFGILFHWRRNTNDLIKKKHAQYLLMSFGISMLLGSFTDSLANRFLDFKFPSLAPIHIMIPVTMIFLIIRKYGLMHPTGKRAVVRDGIILGDQNRLLFFKYIAGMFFMGSMLNLLHYFLYPAQLTSVILFSTILLFMGAAIFLLPFLPCKRDLQDNILAIIIALSIPLILLRFLDNYASNIVWPVPLIFMMITAVFNKKRILIIIGISGLLTGLWSWIRVPNLVVQVGSIDYVSRIVLYGMGIILTIYVNKLYIARLAENEEQVRFQKMISRISTDFITITSLNSNYKLNEMLGRSGQHYHADRSNLYLFSENLQTVNNTNEWCEEGIEPTIPVNEEILVTQYGGWMNQILANEIVFILKGKEMTPAAQAEKELLLTKGIISVLFVPISNKDKVIGFIAFSGIKKKKNLSEMDKEQLKVLANTLADAISKVEAEKEINYMAYNDLLTGLPNRALFKNRLEQSIDVAKRSEKLIGVMLIDLDGFKEVNDAMGHDSGDCVLTQVADRLAGAIRKCDVVARFGGDEFLIMIPQEGEEGDIEEVAGKIMKVFRKPIIVHNQEFFITASGGISLFPIDGETVDILIKHADLAMYASKNNGKGQYCLCSLGMKEDVISKMILTNSLYRALENNELVLYYQPQVNAATKEVIGMEALIRWDHPSLGRIPPSTFIPLAEQTGLITSIGTWVLRTACLQNKRWQDMGLKPTCIAVNISIDQFRGGNLLQVVKTTLAETGLDPRYLELEITEGIAMKEENLIIKTLHELRAMGVEIAIDDFGMAYSSLSRLKELPVDKLKIDMLFVQGVSPKSKDKSIIEVIIHLARSLDLKVTAEGVETEYQLGFLERVGCDEVQGYYYYKPMPAREVEKILKLEDRKHAPLS